MCSLCRSYPCDHRCPNAPEPPSVGRCGDCGEDICVGDKYYEFGEKLYHEECFEYCALDILLDMGAELKIAEEKEFDYDPYD